MKKFKNHIISAAILSIALIIIASIDSKHSPYKQEISEPTITSNQVNYPNPIAKKTAQPRALSKQNDKLYFPSNFLWGVATSAHQVEGYCDNNTWSRWQKKHNLEPSGITCDHWNRYKDDIQLIKQLGVSAYRFSVEWSKIEPDEGVFEESAMQHYIDVCDELLKHGIKPCVTLHHYTDPLWFAQKGGFEDEENIFYYVRFALTVFKRLGNKVHLWFTFNSPDGYAAKGYLNGMAPPGKKNMQSMSEVYKNTLEAHVQFYKQAKIVKLRTA